MFQDILKQYMDTDSSGCVVNRWISTLDKEDQKAFMDAIKVTRANAKAIDLKSLYGTMSTKVENLPYKLTAFRSHMRGYCTCR